ncbi:FtsX-like permease family protein [Labilibaculum sp. A4]|uniref:ABC transporter permease n=1 Tax=Labilibaculum euxinus TaxID=2686357 RepID=UPI000F617D1D|nr:FtsX-like permease family protein [Labilibaculum euxinus]MDQ1769965.1 FtsX-like permease family protein [Labilibaculum euxinus]MWN77387.1 FtsX-like permease family protein [Labilibaculum euxinus]
MIRSVAWRNIWRSPLRSGIIIAAISVGMSAGVFTTTFTKGWMNQRLEAGVETEASHIRIQQPKFGENYDLKESIPNSESLVNEISKLDHINGISPRIVIQSMLASAETGTGVKIIGINPEKEKTVTNLHSKLSEGKYFEGVKRNPILIGAKLAKKLKVKMRSKVVITVQDASGNITGGAFRVCGIFDITSGMFEETNVFVRKTDLARLLDLESSVSHEILVHLDDTELIDQQSLLLKNKHKNLLVQTWKESMPELGYINEIGNLYTYIFVIIILLALGFGIVNTMLMVILERIKELGMLMAIGMSKARIFGMLMLETVLLTFTGGFTGILLGLGATYATMEKGIDLSDYAAGLEDMGYSSHIYPVVELETLVTIAILVLITGIAASVYPARKALKYNPAEAIRTE